MGLGGVPVLAAAERAKVELLVLHAMDRILQRQGTESGSCGNTHKPLLWVLTLTVDGPMAFPSVAVVELCCAIASAHQHQVV